MFTNHKIRKKISKKVMLYCNLLLVIICLIPCTVSNLDLYLPKDEVYKLFGVQNAQLYYMHDGKINQNALDFIARVQPEHNLLKYQWHKTALDMSIPYKIFFKIRNGSRKNQINNDLVKISMANSKDNGVIQKLQGSFQVYINCTGREAKNLTFDTEFVFHWYLGKSSFKQNITIKRLKMCSKFQNAPEKEESIPDLSNKEFLPDVAYISPPPGGSQQSASAFFISIGAVVLFIVVIFLVCCWWHVRMNKKHGGPEHEALHRMRIAQHSGNQFLRLDLPNNIQQSSSHSGLVQFTPFINDLGADIDEIRTKLSDMSLPSDKVTIGELMLKGTFARTYKGSIEDGISVLIKTVTDEATEEQQRLLLFEGSLLRGMHHRNLLTMKYVVLDGAPDVPMVLFPFKEGGNLKHFLQSLKMNETPNAAPGLFSSSLVKLDQVSTQELLEMAIQVACGMTYLSKRGLVHKDLATRNCLIDNDLKVKITDYALSRDTFPGDYCCLGDYENRPVRWLALESLVHKLYSSSSDVWSFGVLLWELQSLAATPYSDIDDFEMADYLSDGFRLSQPINCPDRLYNIMAGCWHYSPDQRPVFTQLLQLLTEFNAELVDYV